MRLVSGVFFGWRPVRAVLAEIAANATMLGTLTLCGSLRAPKKRICRLKWNNHDRSGVLFQ
jgi:hypothetical protein